MEAVARESPAGQRRCHGELGALAGGIKHHFDPGAWEDFVLARRRRKMATRITADRRTSRPFSGMEACPLKAIWYWSRRIGRTPRSPR
jgi:hypothetical protein